jgi:hypothetical protein
MCVLLLKLLQFLCEGDFVHFGRSDSEGFGKNEKFELRQFFGARNYFSRVKSSRLFTR